MSQRQIQEILKRLAKIEEENKELKKLKEENEKLKQEIKRLKTRAPPLSTRIKAPSIKPKPLPTRWVKKAELPFICDKKYAIVKEIKSYYPRRTTDRIVYFTNFPDKEKYQKMKNIRIYDLTKEKLNLPKKKDYYTWIDNEGSIIKQLYGTKVTVPNTIYYPSTVDKNHEPYLDVKPLELNFKRLYQPFENIYQYKPHKFYSFYDKYRNKRIIKIIPSARRMCREIKRFLIKNKDSFSTASSIKLKLGFMIRDIHGGVEYDFTCIDLLVYKFKHRKAGWQVMAEEGKKIGLMHIDESLDYFPFVVNDEGKVTFDPDKLDLLFSNDDESMHKLVNVARNILYNISVNNVFAKRPEEASSGPPPTYYISLLTSEFSIIVKNFTKDAKWSVGSKLSKEKAKEMIKEVRIKFNDIIDPSCGMYTVDDEIKKGCIENNCLFYCLNYITHNKESISTIRKKLNIPKDQMIDISNENLITKILNYYKINVLITDPLGNIIRAPLQWNDDNVCHLIIHNNHI